MRSKIATIKLTLCTKNPTEKTDNRIASTSAALGPKGIKAIDFLKKFDEETKDQMPGTQLCVKLIAELDSNGKAKSFKHFILGQSISTLVKTKLGLEKLASKPGKDPVKKMSNEILEEIVAEKSKHMPFTPVSSLRKSIIGTLKTMGISVESNSNETK